MIEFFVKFMLAAESKKEEEGATAVEYGLMVALIAVFIIGAVMFLAGELDALFRAVGAAL